MKWQTIAAYAAIGILWGTAWIPQGELLRSLPPLRAGAYRFALAAIFTGFAALAARVRSRNAARPKAPSLLPVSLILGATAVAMPYALTAWSAGQISPGAIVVLFALTPLAAVLLSRESMSAAIPVLVIGAGGVVFLVAQGVSFSTEQWKGVILVGCAVFLSAFSLNYARRILRNGSLLASVAIQFAFAAMLLAALSAITERSLSAWNIDAVVSLLALALFVSAVTLPLIYWLLASLDAWQVATLQWSATLIAVAQSAWFLRAGMSLAARLGAALIVGATVRALRAYTSRPDAVTLQITNHLD